MQITVDFPIIADPTREISVKCAPILALRTHHSLLHSSSYMRELDILVSTF